MSRSKTLFSILIHLSLIMSLSLANENDSLSSNNNIFQESKHAESQVEKILQDRINELFDSPVALEGESLSENIASLVNIDLSHFVDNSISEPSVLEKRIQELFAQHKEEFFQSKYDNFLNEARKLVNKYTRSCMILKNSSEDCSVDKLIENVFKNISQNISGNDQKDLNPEKVKEWYMKTIRPELQKNLEQNVSDIADFKSFRNSFSINVKLQLKLIYAELKPNSSSSDLDKIFARFVSIHDSLKDKQSITDSLEIFKYFSRLHIKNQLLAGQTANLKPHSVFLAKVFNEISNSYANSSHKDRTVAQDLLQNYFYSNFGTIDADLSFCSFIEKNLQNNGWHFVESNESNENSIFSQIHISNAAYCLAIRNNFFLSNEQLENFKQNIDQLFDISPKIIHHIANRPSIFFSSNFEYDSSKTYELYVNIYNLYKRSILNSLNLSDKKLSGLRNDDLIFNLERLAVNYDGEIIGADSFAPLDLKNYYVIMKLFLTIHGLPEDFKLNFNELKDIQKSNEMLDSFNSNVAKLGLSPLNSHINNLFKIASINQGLDNPESIFQLSNKELTAAEISSTLTNNENQ